MLRIIYYLKNYKYLILYYNYFGSYVNVFLFEGVRVGDFDMEVRKAWC